MIEPWQVWAAQMPNSTPRPVLILSSQFHLRLYQGRVAVVAPLTSMEYDLDYRVTVTNPKDNRTWWVVADQVRTIDSVYLSGDEPMFSLTESEINQIAHGLKMMVAFA